ncbi:MAG: hypothetical protein ACOX2F_07980 [bacterium]
MQSLKKILFFLSVLILFSTCFANENVSWSGNFSMGTGYDSYIPSLGKDSSKRIGSKELFSDIGLSVDIYDFSIGGSFFFNGLTADNWSHSLITGMINAGWGSTFGDCDLYFTIYGIYSGFDFENFHSYYTEWSADGDIYFNHSDNMSFYFGITGGYTYGLDSMLKYLRGPFVGFNLGEYFYFGKFDSYVRVYGNVNFNFYGDTDASNYSTLGELGISSLAGKNRGVDSTAAVKTRFNLKNLFFALTPSYRNSTMFARDRWEYSDRIVKKRRVDHTLLFEVEPGWRPDDNFTISLIYIFEKNFSTLKKRDYTSENYFRHDIRLIINYDF